MLWQRLRVWQCSFHQPRVRVPNLTHTNHSCVSDFYILQERRLVGIAFVFSCEVRASWYLSGSVVSLAFSMCFCLSRLKKKSLFNSLFPAYTSIISMSLQVCREPLKGGWEQIDAAKEEKMSELNMCSLDYCFSVCVKHLLQSARGFPSHRMFGAENRRLNSLPLYLHLSQPFSPFPSLFIVLTLLLPI